MATTVPQIALSLDELRDVTRFAVRCARPALAVFGHVRPEDPRAREAIDAAQAFADGAPRTKRLRDGAWAALRAAQEARDAQQAAASDAARAAGHACGAAFLHPLAKATQVKHILGSAAHAALALGADIAAMAAFASPIVVDVLRRYPPAPPGGARAGALMRELDALLRA